MQAVLKYLEENKPRFLDELFQYVRFPSVSAQPAHRGDLAACAAWLKGHCEWIGLETRLIPTPGNPVILAKTPGQDRAKRPHFVVYGHYDVQPAEPFNLWKFNPFEPRLEGGKIFGRGSSDNKGQNFAHLKAVEAYLKTGSGLPCDLTFLIEGEEEVGSSHLAGFLKEHKEELRCRSVVISDTGMPDVRHPALTYALRGVAAFEVRVSGPSRDLHSGLYGGTVDNPATALCRILARLHDKRGRVAIPGFYDDVKPLTAFERRELAKFPLHDNAYRKLVGVPKLDGEAGFTTMERRSARPTLEINGLTSGYQGDGSKTIIPSMASVKITCRMVPDQKPKRIISLFRRHLKEICPPTVRIEIEAGHYGEPYATSPATPLAQAALRSLKLAFGRDPILMREGGSIPIVNDFKKIIGADTLLLGLALPDDNAHSPNEKFELACFHAGMRLGAILWPELSRASEVTSDK
jgi:acetylornithine deacetylase/succinyl-diaminopimelate desuccinylase-like protein